MCFNTFRKEVVNFVPVHKTYRQRSGFRPKVTEAIVWELRELTMEIRLCNTIRYYVTKSCPQLITSASHQIWRLRKQNNSCDRTSLTKLCVMFLNYVTIPHILSPVIPRTLLKHFLRQNSWFSVSMQTILAIRKTFTLRRVNLKMRLYFYGY